MCVCACNLHNISQQSVKPTAVLPLYFPLLPGTKSSWTPPLCPLITSLSQVPRAGGPHRCDLSLPPSSPWYQELVNPTAVPPHYLPLLPGTESLWIPPLCPLITSLFSQVPRAGGPHRCAITSLFSQVPRAGGPHSCAPRMHCQHRQRGGRERPSRADLALLPHALLQEVL